MVAVFGPTGSGKTDVAVHLARALGTEVVNCDPAQCYRGLPILTNQPTAQHDAIARHRMVAVWPLHTEATVVEYAQQAHDEIDDLVSTYGTAVVCGGSGLYMRAALTRMSFAGSSGRAEPARREALAAWYDEIGPQPAHARLAALDAAAARIVHANDRKRVVRAIEAAEQGGSVAGGEQPSTGGGLWQTPYRHVTTVVGLQVDRSEVRERITRRTAAMFAAGVLAEVAEVAGTRGDHADRLSATARQLHGLQDCLAVLRGDIDVAEATQRLTTRTHQYAKRQDVWARRWPGMWRVRVGSGSTAPRRTGTLLAAERARHAIREVAGTG